ncbi:hypothetical protein QYM36_013555, partial [Artemia franciscana]
MSSSSSRSPFEAETVLFNINPNGKEMIIQYASRALTEAERKYCRVERVNCRCVYGAFSTISLGEEIYFEGRPKIANLVAYHAKQL